MSPHTPLPHKYYTGVGSRDLPPDIESLMGALGKALQAQGWVLRSGGAPGADTAFEAEVDSSNKQIFLPWRGFSDCGQYQYEAELWHQAQLIAKQPFIYPGWNNASIPAKKLEAIRKLQTRNVFQVLGPDLETPSKMLVCWTPDGAINLKEYRAGITGGTGTAINLASHYNVPVYNLRRNDHRLKIENYLKRSLHPDEYSALIAHQNPVTEEMSL